jgi:hypothetical protein
MRDGKGGFIRGKFHTLKLDELSAVDDPAQEGARAVIWKRRAESTLADPIFKYIDTADGARSFASVLEDSEKDRKHWAALDKIWPAINAVTDSIRSIIGDSKIGWDAKQAMLRDSVENFLREVADKSPDIEAELLKYLEKGVSEMSDIQKQLDDANAELAKAKTDLAAAEKARDAAIAKSADSEKEKKDAEDALEEMKKRGEDEILKVGDTEIRKSVAGEAQFAILKAQQAQIEKQQDTIAMQSFEKRAGDEFGAVVGTDVEKALILKAREVMTADAQKALDAIMTSAQKMAQAGFTETGHQDVNKIADAQKARGDYMAKVNEIAKRDDIPQHAAMQKARGEYPELFKAYHEASQIPAAA